LHPKINSKKYTISERGEIKYFEIPNVTYSQLTFKYHHHPVKNLENNQFQFVNFQKTSCHNTVQYKGQRNVTLNNETFGSQVKPATNYTYHAHHSK
jgi:hypothetical protein